MNTIGSQYIYAVIRCFLDHKTTVPVFNDA
jgi:hypothetical protein